MKKTFYILASFVFLFLVAKPSSAATISGNGALSHNKVKVSSNVSTSLLQKNKAVFSNTVVVTDSTGGNKANKNTGGDVTLTTGDAASLVDLTNAANINTGTSADPCGCSCNVPLDASITDNGVHSWNTISFWTNCSSLTSQKNSAYISNTVVTTDNTGGNNTNQNTGGSVDVTTGSSSSEVTITNTANTNTSL